ncbi:MAG: Fe-S cluster assembly protein SufD [Saprospiraceae bacterium]|nr:Fe-S cluster assembly protein SufD [Saprospiraceae bacterium]
MTATTTDIYTGAKEAYLARIDALISGMNGMGDHPVHALRRHARASLDNTAFPDRKNEDWKYTSVRNLLAQSYAEPEITSPTDAPTATPDACTLVFVNGRFNAQGSDPLPEHVWFGTLREALGQSRVAESVQAATQRILSEPLPVFDALAVGLAPDIYVLAVDDNARVEKPVRLVHQRATGDQAVQSNSSLITCVGRGAEIELIEWHASASPGNASYVNASHKMLVGDGATCNVYRLQMTAPDIHLIANTKIFQERDSVAGVYSAELGAKLMRHNLHVLHEGTNITTNLYGVFIAGEGQHTDTQSFIDHAIPHCQSNELYKGILAGNGRGVFNGKIIVRQDAQKTNAFQQNSTLVLSPNAVMDSKPQLEIYADDVRCSHGATIGQLDEEALFYLRSRGLSASRAGALLQKAFVQDVLDHFPNQEIAGTVSKHIDSVMSHISVSGS